MNTKDDKLPEDKQLSSLYKQTEHEMPSAQIDDAIISAAKNETKTYSLPYAPFSNNWRIPASLAAILVLSVGVVTLMEDEFSPVSSEAPLAINDDELFPAPSELAETSQLRSVDTLAKAPMKARVKPSLKKPTATSPATMEDNDLEQRQFELKKRELQRDVQLARKKKQVSKKIEEKMANSLSLAAAIPLAAPNQDAGVISTGTDEQAMLPYWQYQDEGMSIRLIQRLPDQTRGYFVARGFSNEHAELIAQSCVFQTIFKNISDKSTPSAIVYNMNNWVVTHQGVASEMKTREKWAEQWQQLKIATPARLAFEWSLLPTTQDYQAGDYNWGMAIFNLAPADTFTAKISWQQYGKQRNITIPNMQCAADIHADPEAP